MKLSGSIGFIQVVNKPTGLMEGGEGEATDPSAPSHRMLLPLNGSPLVSFQNIEIINH